MTKIKAELTIEIMGRPAEHIKEALNTLVIKMGSEKGVSLVDKKYYEPKPIEESKNLFTTFAKVDAKFETIEDFFNILMGYLPANAEIYEPGKFKLDARDINELGNFILGKLHRYDAVTKRALVEKNILAKQLKNLKEEASPTKKEVKRVFSKKK